MVAKRSESFGTALSKVFFVFCFLSCWILSFFWCPIICLLLLRHRYWFYQCYSVISLVKLILFVVGFCQSYVFVLFSRHINKFVDCWTRLPHRHSHHFVTISYASIAIKARIQWMKWLVLSLTKQLRNPNSALSTGIFFGFPLFFLMNWLFSLLWGEIGNMFRRFFAREPVDLMDFYVYLGFTHWNVWSFSE